MHDPSNPFYLPLRAIHLLGVAVFLGGLVSSIAWKLAADRSRDAIFAAAAHRTLRKLDGRIIGTGALLTFVGGYAMVRFLGGRIAQHAFVLWGLILMFAALALWYFGMRRVALRLADDADAAAQNAQPLGRDYAKQSVLWLAFAFAAAGLVVLTALLMVFRFPSG